MDQTHWAPVQRNKPLATFYYHEHFVEMLAFVEKYYAHVLNNSQRAFLVDYRRLSKSAQCLFVRLANRKGRVFASNKLRYPELGSPGPILDEMRSAGFAGSPGAEYINDILRFLTKSEIYAIVKPRIAGLPRSLKKAQLIEFVRENVCADEFVAALSTTRLFIQRRVTDLDYLLYLYFGRIQQGLSRFTMRDLGIVKTQQLADDYQPRFTDREEALEHYYFATRLHRFDNADRYELSRMLTETDDWPDPQYAGSATLRDQLALQLGRLAAADGDIDRALQVFALGESSDCSERLARLLLSSGRRDDAQQFLEQCINAPRSENEWLFACDLYERKFNRKRTSNLTDELRSAQTLQIDEAKSGNAERAAIEYYQQQGLSAYRTENLFWRTLFGLLFWEELFGAESGTVSSPFEFVPPDLASGQWSKLHCDAIATRLALLSDRARLRQHLLKISTRYYGTANGIFRWRQSMSEALFAFVDHAPPASADSILRRMCEDYATNRHGFPDLMLIDNQTVRFVEIKAAGDQLRRTQLLRLQQLREAGFDADVVRIEWTLDPAQTYVVVDVETTGGRGETHRVTEIGAVKIRNGETIGSFQTLLNPQRGIPGKITRLTGITPAMVADAPYFIDIADEFREFMGDAIFVAHNVEFDYGFIAREYRRTGRSFRHAKLCTCATMRKLFPGHRSYSLAALTRAYNIPLAQHHRALCDAEAAAQLLLIINEKRAAS